jgi:hypothetical protein
MASADRVKRGDLSGLEFSLSSHYNGAGCANCGGNLYIEYHSGDIHDWSDDWRHYAAFRPAPDAFRPALNRYLYLCVICAKKFGVAS